MAKKQTKVKVQLPKLGSFAEMEVTVGDVASATMAMEALDLDLDTQIGAVRAQFLKEHGGEVQKYQQLIANGCSMVRDWAERNRGAYFETRQSLDTKFGVVKFFRGQYKAEVKTRGGWEAVMRLIRTFKLTSRFIRTIEEPNREALIAARDEKDGEQPLMTKLGVKITQEETFTIDIKREAKPTLAAQPKEATHV